MNKQIAVFGGGCFWCTETIFLHTKGVISVTPGYAGGTSQNPNYYSIHEENGGHAEVVKLEYDPSIISYDTLLNVFFYIHNPSSLNRQGADVGTEYRSIILYTTKDQQNKANAKKKELENKGTKVTTEIKELDKFYDAESYHQDFYKKNQNSTYCNLVIVPKLDHFKEEFADIFKE